MAGSDTSYRLYISGYTGSTSDQGIQLFEIDPEAKAARLLAGATGIESPSYCLSAGDEIYAASETSTHGGLASYVLDEDGCPTMQSSISFEKAAGTCFALLHPNKTQLYGADYNSGSVCECPIDVDGSPLIPVKIFQHEGNGKVRPKDDPNHGRQDTPHVHTLSFIPGTTYLAAVDLGLDAIVIYKTDERGHIVDAEEPPAISAWPDDIARPEVESYGANPVAVIEAPFGSGPRIVAYHPSLPYVALICELGCELIIYRIEDGGLRWVPLRSWNLLEDAPPESEFSSHPPLSAHCAFSNDGRFLYASTRGSDQMAVFELDDQCDMLDKTSCYCGGSTPRHFALSRDEKLLAVANQTSGNVAVFQRDAKTGKLAPLLDIPFATPSCVVWK